MDSIFIPGSVPSSKNSRRNFKNVSLPSKTVVKWRKNTQEYWHDNYELFMDMIKDKEKPYKISMKFVRGTKHKFDYINPAQTIQDELVKYGYIEDDNCDEMIPYFEPYEYNKDNPGVYIRVL